MSLILVTGSTTGVGLATVEGLVAAGHDVVLHARTPERAAGLAITDRVRAVVHGDLGDRDETLRLAEEVEALGRFDAVIHNAGVTTGPDVFAVNLVAPYLLTARTTPPGRWIALSSSMHRSGSTDLERLDLGDSSRTRGAYETSKLCVTALAMALADARTDTPAHAVDPGWVPTRMGGSGASDSLAEAPRTQEWLATADLADITPPTGGYWYHREPDRPHPAALDPAFQARLLNRLEEHTGVALP